MTQDPRPPKRPRHAIVDGETEDSVDGLERSEEFWIEDGNIVLVAGKTAFRVYRGLLALQSTVFADLFASSSPSAEESYDGCPVIRLTDSPQDLAQLLRVLLPTSRASLYRSTGDPPLSLNKISAIIRLTHKYHVEDLLRQALSALQDALTSSFETWEDESRVPPVDLTGADPIAAVNLARLTDTPEILPHALYDCCAVGPDLIDGREREDGTREYLSPADLKRCIGAREVLAKEAFSLVSVIFDPKISDDCATPHVCILALRDTLASVLRSDVAAEPTVLDTWAPTIRDGAHLQDHGVPYCSACERELLARDVRERRRIWNQLPQIFDVDVPNWNQDLGGQGAAGNADGNAGN